MPQAAVAAGLWSAVAAGAAQIGGAVIGARAQGKSQKEQLKANERAMAYEQQKQAQEEKRRAEHAAAYRQAWMDWYGRVGDQGVQRYGVPVGIQLPGKASGTPAPKPSGGDFAPPPSTSTPYVPPSATAPISPAAAPMAPAVTPGATPTGGMAPGSPNRPMDSQGASLGGWEDWNRYGVGA